VKPLTEAQRFTVNVTYKLGEKSTRKNLRDAEEYKDGQSHQEKILNIPFEHCYFIAHLFVVSDDHRYKDAQRIQSTQMVSILLVEFMPFSIRVAHSSKLESTILAS
jgi:hypothetical protein